MHRWHSFPLISGYSKSRNEMLTIEGWCCVFSFTNACQFKTWKGYFWYTLAASPCDAFFIDFSDATSLGREPLRLGDPSLKSISPSTELRKHDTIPFSGIITV